MPAVQASGPIQMLKVRLTLESLIADTVQDQSCPPRGAVPAPIKGLLSELISTTEEMPPSKAQITLRIGRMLETSRPPKDVGLWSQHDKTGVSRQARVAPATAVLGRGRRRRTEYMEHQLTVLAESRGLPPPGVRGRPRRCPPAPGAHARLQAKAQQGPHSRPLLCRFDTVHRGPHLRARNGV